MYTVLASSNTINVAINSKTTVGIKVLEKVTAIEGESLYTVDFDNQPTFFFYDKPSSLEFWTLGQMLVKGIANMQQDIARELLLGEKCEGLESDRKEQVKLIKNKAIRAIQDTYFIAR